MMHLKNYPYQNLLELVEARNHSNEHACYIFDSEDSVQQLLYREVYDEAKKIAAFLQQHQLENQPIIIMMQPGLSYIKAFFGCLFAKAIAVPCNMIKKSDERFENISKNIKSRYILTEGENTFLKEQGYLGLNLHENPFSPADYEPVLMHQEQIAFLQYTSGSTSATKGVMVTHRNLLSNLQAMQNRFQIKSHEYGCSWLPPFHDMGLIGGILFPFFAGFTTILMSPQRFLKNPLIWLQTISKYKAVISPAPNFAYDLCNTKINDKDLSDLDLSPWRFALNGAEAIYPGTLNKFYEKFKVTGFRQEAFYPTYGLAEAVLLVSGKQKACDSITIQKKNNIEYVSCGQIIENHDLKIVDGSKKNIMPIDEEGEIWVAGDSITQGYYNLPSDTYNNTLPNYSYAYIRTGDRGFVNAKGELFITGRFKEMLIIRGVNYYPQDLERICYESHPNLIQHAAAIFQTDSNSSGFIIVQEVKRHTKEFNSIYQAILEAIFKQFSLRPTKIILIRQASLSMTTSGKIKRIETLKQYENNQLLIIDQWPNNKNRLREKPSTHWLKSWITNRTGTSTLTNETLLISVGFDSLLIAEFLSDIETHFKIALSLDDFYEIKTIKELEEIIEKKTTKKMRASQFNPKPSQQEYSILHFSNELNKHFFNIPLLFKICGDLNLTLLTESFNEMIAKHEILNVAYCQTDMGEWIKKKITNITVDMNAVDLSLKKKKQIKESLIQMANQYELFQFNFNKPPLFKCIVIKTGKKTHYLLIILSHLIFDGVSTYLFIQELATIYNNLKLNISSENSIIALPYSAFVDKQADKTLNKKCEQYWKKRIAIISKLPVLPSNNLRDFQCHTLIKTLSPSLVKKLLTFSKAFGVTLYSILYSIFAIWIHFIEKSGYIHFKTLYSNRRYSSELTTLGFLADGILVAHEVNPQITVSEWVKQCHFVIREDFANLSLSMKDILKLLPASHQNCYPTFAFSFNNYLKTIELMSCKVSIENKYFSDNLMWGDTVNTALHVYQINEKIFLRLRGLKEKYSDETLSKNLQLLLKLIYNVAEHPHKKIAEM